MYLPFSLIVLVSSPIVRANIDQADLANRFTSNLTQDDFSPRESSAGIKIATYEKMPGTYIFQPSNRGSRAQGVGPRAKSNRLIPIGYRSILYRSLGG